MQLRLFERRFYFVVLVCAIICSLSLSACKLGPFQLPFGSSSLEGLTEVDESGLDTVVGNYSYQGESHDITVREVLTSSASLDYVRRDDGKYPVPSADDILGYVRNRIILEEAHRRSLEVSEDEIRAYARDNFGMDDFAMLALNFGMDEASARQLMADAALMAKLRGQVVTASVEHMPELPTTPEEGSENTPTKEYADYVLALAADEWDSEHNSWADTTGPYYEALSNMIVSNDEATYEAAMAAYYVAYGIYGSSAQLMMGQWTNYVNTLLSHASITISTLAA